MKVGCGCGKSRPSRSSRLASQRLKQLSIRKKSLNMISPLGQKIGICKSCSFSVQTKDEKKRGIKICHKTNRLINNIIKDIKFKCPVRKW